MVFSYRLPAALIGATMTIVQPQLAVAQLSPEQVEALGKEVTVRIDGGGGGSGIIIDRKHNTYFVLTAHHVVRYPERYEIQTSDGSRYLVYKAKELPGFDLAVVQFESNKRYRVAELGNSDQLTGGAEVYVAGFPVPQPGIPQRYYRFSAGKFMRYQQEGDNGYTMVYNSQVIPGMSGGPVLDGVGRVVGINGRSYNDLRLGIPINSFLANQGNLRQAQDSSAENTLPPRCENLLSSGGGKAKKGDYQSAIRDYQKALEICPDNPDAYYLIGVAQYNAGNKQAAIENFNQVIRINPKNTDAYIYRGVVRSGLGDKQGAIADYSEAIRLNPNYALVYNNRGIVRSDLGDKQGAIADYSEAIRLNPNYADAYGNRCKASSELGNQKQALEQALEDCNEALKINPNHVNNYNIRAKVRSDLGDKQGAIADYSEAIRLNPNLAEAYLGRGNVRSNQGDKQGAIADYSEAIRLNPNLAEAYLGRGNVQSNQGDEWGAIADYNKAIRLNPNLTEANLRLNYIRLRQRDEERRMEDYKRRGLICPHEDGRPIFCPQ